MNRKTLFLAAAAMLVGTSAAAQQSANAPQRPRVEVDSNGDGAVSRAEAQAAADTRWARMDANRDGRLDQADWQQIRTQRRAEMFSRLDADGNGSITRAEWDQAADARAARMGERMARRGQGAGRGGEGRRGGHMGRGGRGEGGGMGMMARLDTNRDRVITREEFNAAVLARHAAMDSNGDGSVTAAERQAQRAERRERRGARQGSAGE